jgi:hypothetical protein
MNEILRWLSSGLPDGIFANQNSQFRYILEGVRMENVGLFYGNVVPFVAIWYISWTFDVFCIFLVHFYHFGIMCQEKSGNTGCRESVFHTHLNNRDSSCDWLVCVAMQTLGPTDSRSGWPGVDVMITIFGDFRQFSAKKMAFFSKTNVMIKFLHNLALFWVKKAKFFAEFFGENI